MSRLSRCALRTTRRVREVHQLARAVFSTEHPLLAHVVIARRCNLSCAYCNEFDTSSAPVDLAPLLRRVDHLAKLGTSAVTVTGGEPLLHPAVCNVIQRIRHNGMIAGMITNGFLLDRPLINALNRAGLDHLQISIDNVLPDAVSKKSLKTLDVRLQWLADLATFDVNINSVVGAGMQQPDHAAIIARRAVQLGFTSTVGILHDGSGQLKPLGERELQAWRAVRALGRRGYARLDAFQRNLAEGLPNEWHCRAGARYLYICEDGHVHYCSQQRGRPGTPLLEYTAGDLRTAYMMPKACAPHCTVGCVHRISAVDSWRDPQHGAGVPPPGLHAIALVRR